MNYSDKFGATSFQEISSPLNKGGFDFSIPGNTAAQQAPSGFIKINDAELLFSGTYKREGSDLVISNDVRKLIVPDYFKGEARPTLTSRDGATLSGKIVEALTGHVNYAQAAGTPEPPKEIGSVVKLTGSATAIRNGVAVELKIGDKVYKGDVIQSGQGSSLGISFIDGTAFSLSSNARMVLNEMVYDPNGTSNSSLLSLVQGTITFVAGQTAKNGNMRVDTPVATMGIRGTAVLVEIGADNGPTKFSVLVEPGNKVGTFNLYDKTTGSLLGTVSQAGQVTLVTPAGIGQQATAVEIPKTNADFAAEKQLIQQVFQIFFPNYNDANPQGTKTGGSSVNNLATLIDQAGKVNPGTILLDTKVNLPGSSGPISVTVTASTTPPPIVITNVADIQPPEEKGGEFDIGAQIRPDSRIIPYIAGSGKLDTAEGPESMPSGFPLRGLVTLDAQTGRVTYNPADFRFLADGEQAIYTFSFQTQADEFIFTKTLTLTIDGLNDAPIFTVENFASPINESLTTDSNSTFSKQSTLTFNDADFSDVSSGYTVQTLGVTATGTTTAVPNAATLLGFLHFNSVVKAVGSTQGVITETFTAPESAFDYLAAGETVNLAYRIRVTDEDGASRIATLNVTVTGTNDAPTITGATTPCSTSGDLTEDGVLTASGVITFRDVDLSNSHNAVASHLPTSGSITSPLPGFNPATSSLGSLVVTVNENTADANNIGTVSWVYSLDNLVAQRLAEGQVVTQTFTVTITDSSGATVTQPVTVTIAGTNDVPEIVLGEVNLGDDDSIVETIGEGSVTEPVATETEPLSAEGIVVFQDVDLIDTHTFTVARTSSDASADLPGFNEGLGETDGEGAVDYIGTFALGDIIGDNGDTIDLGAVNWTFTLDPNDPTLQSLAKDQTITQVYTITITDSSGASVSKDVTITITGTNDAPTVGAAVTEVLGEPTDDSALSASIAVDFSDIDLIDVEHSATILGVSPTGPMGNLSAGDLLALASLGAVTKASGSQSGTFNLEFNAAAGTFDYLADGEALTLVYTVQIDDGDGGKVSQSVSVTINGTNDLPVIAEAGATGEVTEAGTPSDDLIDTGTIAFSDVDLSDAHVIDPVVVASPGALGTLTASVTADTTGFGTNGEITWHYSVDPLDVEYLAEGETKVETFTITLDDGHDTVTRTIEVTIIGTNDAPTVSAAVTEILGEPTDDSALSASIAVDFSDIDLIDVEHSATILGVSPTGPMGNLSAGDLLALASLGAVTKASGSQSGTFNLEFNAAAGTFDYLADGEALTLVYTVQIDDGDGGKVSQSVSVTINGTNDAPVITSNGGEPFTAPVAENSTEVTTVTATDADNGATIAYSIVSGVGDAALFTIDEDTGALSFIAAPDYEAPIGGDNSYVVQVRAFDGLDEDIQTITVNVTDEPEGVAGNDIVSALENTPAGLTQLSVNDQPGHLIVEVHDEQHGTATIGPGNVTFLPETDFSGIASFQYDVSDDGGDTITGTATVTVNVAPLAAMPTFVTGSSASGNEEATISLGMIDAAVADTDGSETLVLKLSGFPAGAVFFVAGEPVGTLGTVAPDIGKFIIDDPSVIEALASSPLTVTPPANYNGNFTLHIDAVVTDTAVLTTGLATDTKTFGRDVNVSVSPENDAPVITSASFDVDEGGATVLGAGDIVVDDPDNASHTFTVADVEHGTFQRWVEGDAWEDVTTFTSAQVNVGMIRFAHDGSEFAPGFRIQANDGGFINNLSQEIAGSINFTNVNDAPAITVDHALESDAGSGAGRPVPYTVQLPNLGIATDAAVTVEFWLKDALTPAQSSMMFGFQQYDLINVDYGGARGHVFGFNTGNGDVYGIKLPDDFSSEWHHIAAVFKPGLYGSRLYIDGVEQTLQLGLGNHPEAPGVAFFTDTPRIGGWTISDDYSFQGQIDDFRIWHGERSQSDIAANMDGLHGSTADLVANYKFEQVSDGAGGVIDSSGNSHHGTLSAYTVEDNIVQVQRVTAAEDKPLVFSVANDNAIKLSDTDGGDLTLSLSVAHGVLTLSSMTGLTVEGGANGSSSVTVTGTVAALNAALDGLTYVAPDHDGGDLLAISVDDGVAPPVTKQLAIDIRPINDAPTLDNAAVTVNENETSAGLLISEIFSGKFHDVDTGASFAGIAVTGGVTSEAGTWQFSYDNQNWRSFDQYLGLSSSALLPSDAWLRFVPNQDFEGTADGLRVIAMDNTIVPEAITTSGNPQIVDLDPAHYTSLGMTPPRGGSFGFAADITTIGVTVEPQTPPAVAGNDTLTILGEANIGAVLTSYAYNDGVAGSFEVISGEDINDVVAEPVDGVIALAGSFGTLLLVTETQPVVSLGTFSIGNVDFPVLEGTYIYVLGIDAEGNTLEDNPISLLRPGDPDLVDIFHYTIENDLGDESTAQITVTYDLNPLDMNVRTDSGYDTRSLWADLHDGFITEIDANHIKLEVRANGEETGAVIKVIVVDAAALTWTMGGAQGDETILTGGTITGVHVFDASGTVPLLDFTNLNMHATIDQGRPGFYEAVGPAGSSEAFVELFQYRAFDVHGGAGVDVLYGGLFNDRIDTGGNPAVEGGDTVFAGGGNDLILIHDDNNWGINGGEGIDTVRFVGEIHTGQGSGNSTASSIEVIDLNTTHADTLLIDGEGAANINEDDKLHVLGNASDLVNFENSDAYPDYYWHQVTSDEDGYRLYEFVAGTEPGDEPAASVYVQNAVGVNFAPVIDADHIFVQELGYSVSTVFDLKIYDDDDASNLTVTTMAMHGTLNPPGIVGTEQEINEELSFVDGTGVTYTPTTLEPIDIVTVAVTDRHGLRDELSFVFNQSGPGGVTLVGTGGKDLIFSSDGNDEMWGDPRPEDSWYGQTGRDNFVFAPDNGQDTIMDFQSGIDRIDLRQFAGEVDADTIDDWLVNHASPSGTDTLIAFDANNSILVKHVAHLSANDFILHPGGQVI